MPSLVVGGTTIPVAKGTPSWGELGAVDRARAFDNTYRASQTGGAAREWTFSTPPVSIALGAAYKARLRSVAPQLCSGDILELPTMCGAELMGGTPVKLGYEVVNFKLHEAQAARVLLSYAPGDTITGESFTRATAATYMTTAGLVASAASGVKRDSHFATMGGVRSLLLEDARTNAFTFSEQLDNAAWTKGGATINADVVSSPDGTATADGIIESSLTEEHYILRLTPALTDNALQTLSFFGKAATRDWLSIATTNKAGTVLRSWVNVLTGLPGTVAAGHTVKIVTFGSGWFRLSVTFNAGSGGTTPFIAIALATGDAVSSYLGTGAGLFVWGIDFETDKSFASSYKPTAGSTFARNADFYSIPFTTPPQEMSVYAKWVNQAGAAPPVQHYVFAIESAANVPPQLLSYESTTVPVTHHDNGPAAFVSSSLAALPAFMDSVERVSYLIGDGSVSSTQSLNGGTATSSTPSAAVAFATAWSGELFWLNSPGTVAGFNGFRAIQSFKIVAGSRSLAEMRVL